jgi:hypothetical protein
MIRLKWYSSIPLISTTPMSFPQIPITYITIDAAPVAAKATLANGNKIHYQFFKNICVAQEK